ncbi:hypothetical protein QAD02_021653 [Eretmocerus hayati]|uniref:Uncharacterized protein n=1 Tax=Eretmocerus hayati TaxID=131215 RepID=A0ACC2PVP1_9HYME|nr:hypothetical protein QAD02_021653 [Eretmocerus hayati]
MDLDQARDLVRSLAARRKVFTRELEEHPDAYVSQLTADFGTPPDGVHPWIFRSVRQIEAVSDERARREFHDGCCGDVIILDRTAFTVMKRGVVRDHFACGRCHWVGSRMYRYPALELKVPIVWHDHQLMAAQLKMKNIYFTGHPLVVRLRRDNGQRSSLLLYDDMQDELPVVDYWLLDLVGGDVHFVSCGGKPLRMVFPVRVDWCGISLLFIVHIMGHVPPSNRRRIEWSTDEHPQTENFEGQVMFC